MDTDGQSSTHRAAQCHPNSIAQRARDDVIGSVFHAVARDEREGQIEREGDPGAEGCEEEGEEGDLDVSRCLCSPRACSMYSYR